jgi:predicted membrane channel-forming protein YqfA (hemolysin III family)
MIKVLNYCAITFNKFHILYIQDISIGVTEQSLIGNQLLIYNQRSLSYWEKKVKYSEGIYHICIVTISWCDYRRGMNW